MKMIRAMTEAEIVLKDDSQRPQVYRPARREEHTQLQLVDDLIQRGFGGSAMKLVLRAASAQLTARRRTHPDQGTLKREKKES